MLRSATETGTIKLSASQIGAVEALLVGDTVTACPVKPCAGGSARTSGPIDSRSDESSSSC